MSVCVIPGLTYHFRAWGMVSLLGSLHTGPKFPSWFALDNLDDHIWFTNPADLSGTTPFLFKYKIMWAEVSDLALVGSITLSPYISLACIIFTQTRGVRIGNFETCPWVKCRRCSQGSNASHWAVRYYVMNFATMWLDLLFRTSGWESKATLFIPSGLLVICSILLQGLHEITDKALTSSDSSNKCEDFVSLVQNWLIKIQVFLTLHINQYLLSLEKHAELYISYTLIFLFLQVSVPTVFWSYSASIYNLFSTVHCSRSIITLLSGF